MKGRKSSKGCKVCDLSFNEENKDLFYFQTVRRTDGTFCKRYKKHICKKCLISRLDEKTKKTREFLRKIKENTPCVDCKKNYPYYVMHFDHLRDKEFHLGGANKGLPRLLKEMQKCEVVCANCHAERTHKRRLKISP